MILNPQRFIIDWEEVHKLKYIILGDDKRYGTKCSKVGE